MFDHNRETAVHIMNDADELERDTQADDLPAAVRLVAMRLEALVYAVFAAADDIDKGLDRIADGVNG